MDRDIYPGLKARSVTIGRYCACRKYAGESVQDSEDLKVPSFPPAAKPMAFRSFVITLMLGASSGSERALKGLVLPEPSFIDMLEYSAQCVSFVPSIDRGVGLSSSGLLETTDLLLRSAINPEQSKE